jgi:hypothetical protein
MERKVIFNFKQHIETPQEDICIFLPIDDIPKQGHSVSFNYKLTEDLANTTCVAQEIRYNYFKGGLDCIVVYLKAAEQKQFA